MIGTQKALSLNAVYMGWLVATAATVAAFTAMFVTGGRAAGIPAPFFPLLVGGLGGLSSWFWAKLAKHHGVSVWLGVNLVACLLMAMLAVQVVGHRHQLPAKGPDLSSMFELQRGLAAARLAESLRNEELQSWGECAKDHQLRALSDGGIAICKGGKWIVDEAKQRPEELNAQQLPAFESKRYL